jgi:hypothetical protein
VRCPVDRLRPSWDTAIEQRASWSSPAAIASKEPSQVSEAPSLAGGSAAHDGRYDGCVCCGVSRWVCQSLTVQPRIQPSLWSPAASGCGAGPPTASTSRIVRAEMRFPTSCVRAIGGPGGNSHLAGCPYLASEMRDRKPRPAPLSIPSGPIGALMWSDAHKCSLEIGDTAPEFVVCFSPVRP